MAAKFMSLPPNMFCYAGETHLIPFMHSMFGNLPCLPEKIDLVKRFLHQQLMTALVEMPRFSVNQGAHPKNLIFDENSVDELVELVGLHLNAGLYGLKLHEATLVTLGSILSKLDARSIRGEKTPSNIFAMAEYAGNQLAKNVVIMREPFSALLSMKARVDGGDKYADAFKGDLESRIGMYLEYALAARRTMDQAENLMLIRYEDMALAPRKVMENIYSFSCSKPEERVLKFVEQGRDPEIANRAPMNYRRLEVKSNSDVFSPADIWKIHSLTSIVRNEFGYSDEAMKELGFESPSLWTGGEIPKVLLPLYGFSAPDSSGGHWMKKRAGVVVYLPQRKVYELTVHFKSNFPDLIDEEVELKVFINGQLRNSASVTHGEKKSTVNILFSKDELVPMGAGGYVIVDFFSSNSYCELGHYPSGVDALEHSFQLQKNWTLSMKSTGLRKW